MSGISSTIKGPPTHKVPTKAFQPGRATMAEDRCQAGMSPLVSLKKEGWAFPEVCMRKAQEHMDYGNKLRDLAVF